MKGFKRLLGMDGGERPEEERRAHAIEKVMTGIRQKVEAGQYDSSLADNPADNDTLWLERVDSGKVIASNWGGVLADPFESIFHDRRDFGDELIETRLVGQTPDPGFNAFSTEDLERMVKIVEDPDTVKASVEEA